MVFEQRGRPGVEVRRCCCTVGLMLAQAIHATEAASGHPSHLFVCACWAAACECLQLELIWTQVGQQGQQGWWQGSISASSILAAQHSTARRHVDRSCQVGKDVLCSCANCRLGCRLPLLCAPNQQRQLTNITGVPAAAAACAAARLTASGTSRCSISTPTPAKAAGRSGAPCTHTPSTRHSNSSHARGVGEVSRQQEGVVVVVVTQATTCHTLVTSSGVGTQTRSRSSATNARQKCTCQAARLLLSCFPLVPLLTSPHARLAPPTTMLDAAPSGSSITIPWPEPRWWTVPQPDTSTPAPASSWRNMSA